jgi:3-hydroxyisobutyrate dehydrogenase-like beta-hydroxyacid dehydrogenase
MNTSFIGFGEAAMAFAEGWHRSPSDTFRAYDIKTDDPNTREKKLADYARLHIEGADTLSEALHDAHLVLSLVTANQALIAACAAASVLPQNALFCDMNSVAPDTKRQAANFIEGRANGRYVDIAVMAPVQADLQKVPLLSCGPHSKIALTFLGPAGFSIRDISEDTGAASTIKMIRSIMIKGLEALSAECLLSARAARVDKEVIASLNATFPGIDWHSQGDYNLDRMLTHGLRRAAEMRESATTVAALGQGGLMARATAEWQQHLGELAFAPPQSFEDKADAILSAIGHVQI